MKKPAFLAALCALVLVSIPTGAARSAADDPCLQPGETPVQLRTSDGASVYGVEVGTGATGIVFGHQLASDHCEFMDLARELAQRGYRSLSIDFRGNGASSGGDGRRLDRDVAAAVSRLRADGATRVKLVGASMGGKAVLQAASWITPVVIGVVSLSGRAPSAGSMLCAPSSGHMCRCAFSRREATPRSPSMRERC